MSKTKKNAWKSTFLTFSGFRNLDLCTTSVGVCSCCICGNPWKSPPSQDLSAPTKLSSTVDNFRANKGLLGNSGSFLLRLLRNLLKKHSLIDHFVAPCKSHVIDVSKNRLFWARSLYMSHGLTRTRHFSTLFKFACSLRTTRVSDKISVESDVGNVGKTTSTYVPLCVTYR